MKLVAESKIDGDCEGFSGYRVFALTNGQNWQQAVLKFRYYFRRRPPVKIWEYRGDHYLEIDGMGEKILVRRV